MVSKVKARIAAVALAVAAVAAPLAAGAGRAGTIDPKALPLGDGHVSTSPRAGWVDACQTSFPNRGGARAIGPWIDEAAGTWNYTTKLHVSGTVSWPQASYRQTVSGSRRVLRFNDLPTSHASGVFPIAASDPAVA